MNWGSRQLSSHLFQRVASFLLEMFKKGLEDAGLEVLISFREWLHSYNCARLHGGFIF